jgi:short subunit dehydrogenase-like uncharacterized protein
MSGRAYDIVLYGAGGFTGRQTVAYLASHPDAALIRWAIAGRNRTRLEEARARAGPGAKHVDILIADSTEPDSVDAIVSRARVVASTAGPFALYGTPVVDACVRFRTHYADITGETMWVHELIERYDARAAADGTRIVPFCGFDSVPSDLGTLLLVRHVQQTLGMSCAEVRGYFQMSGGLNGGTIATALNAVGSKPSLADHRFLLDPPGPHSPEQRARSRDRLRPHYDVELGSWVGPFFMAPTNTRVVRRSVALHDRWNEAYGPDFVYQEYLMYDPPFARVKATFATLGLGLFGTLLRWKPTRRVLSSRLPQPGTGPSIDIMNRGWFTCDLLAIAADGRVVHGHIGHRGDPGNRATVRFLCESALALALDGESLPGGPSRGGVLTPATALGDVLARRLANPDVEIEMGERTDV